jgi:hypothetical protein
MKCPKCQQSHASLLCPHCHAKEKPRRQKKPEWVRLNLASPPIMEQLMALGKPLPAALVAPFQRDHEAVVRLVDRGILSVTEGKRVWKRLVNRLHAAGWGM